MENIMEPELRRRIEALIEDGQAVWQRFDAEVRSQEFHPFMPAEYGKVLDFLAVRRPAPGERPRFLEWGSATGVIAIMADMLGWEAYGIELDAELVRLAREMAERHGSTARFAAGSFLPDDYTWESPDGDRRLGTLGEGRDGYGELGLEVADFDVVFGYAWDGESEIMQDVMRQRGREDAQLILWNREV